MANIAVVGATGAVGVEVLDVLARRKFPIDSLRLFASEQSKDRVMNCGNGYASVETLKEGCFDGIDVAIFSAGSEISRKWARHAADGGCVVVDNSSAFRMDKDVPLVVSEINGNDVERHKGIIANPNCTTAITVMALYPLHCAFGLKWLIASTYQAASGAGQRGMDKLRDQLSAIAQGHEPIVEFFPHQIAGNVFPQVGSFMPSGYTDEEEKMQNEGRKIMHHPTFKASVTCFRVPVFRAHTIAVSAEFERPVTKSEATAVLAGMPGLKVLDLPERSVYPTPVHATGEDDCFVGRIRKSMISDNGLDLVVCGDQLRKGAALNAVQIAERVIN
jgi:aspartate-semialdehyde dehydrogenase